MLLEKLMKLYNRNKAAFIGLAIGFLIAVAILIFGFFRVLFVVFLAGIGYYIGNRINEDEDYIKNLLDRILPPGSYR